MVFLFTWNSNFALTAKSGKRADLTVIEVSFCCSCRPRVLLILILIEECEQRCLCSEFSGVVVVLQYVVEFGIEMRDFVPFLKWDSRMLIYRLNQDSVNVKFLLQR